MIPLAGQKTNPIRQTGFSPYLDRSLPCGPGLTASESETPLAFVLPNCAQIAPAYEAVLKVEENPRALDLTYVCDATTRRAAKTSRALVLVQLRQVRGQIFFCIFSIVCIFYNFVYFTTRAVDFLRPDTLRFYAVGNPVTNAK